MGLAASRVYGRYAHLFENLTFLDLIFHISLDFVLLILKFKILFGVFMDMLKTDVCCVQSPWVTLTLFF